MDGDPLTVGDESPLIATCKRKLGVFPDDEVFTVPLAQRVRGLQLAHGLETSGFIDGDVLRILEVSE